MGGQGDPSEEVTSEPGSGLAGGGGQKGAEVGPTKEAAVVKTVWRDKAQRPQSPNP